MAQPHDASLVTPAEYLAFERGSETKHEYLAGRVFAVAGASPKHNLVCGNVIRALGERLRTRRCAVIPSDQHVYVEATRLGTYPDVTVLCGQAQRHVDLPQSLVNPTVLVEALSPSTEAYDRGAKFDHYRRIDTLREYVLVSTDRFAVDVYLREADGTWRLSAARGRDAELRLASVEVAFPRFRGHPDWREYALGETHDETEAKKVHGRIQGGRGEAVRGRRTLGWAGGGRPRPDRNGPARVGEARRGGRREGAMHRPDDGGA